MGAAQSSAPPAGAPAGAPAPVMAPFDEVRVGGGGRRRAGGQERAAADPPSLPPPSARQPALAPAPARLYRFTGAAWQLYSASARPTFFDAAKEGGGGGESDDDGDDDRTGPRWHLDAGGVTTPVTDEYAADAGERRVTLAAPGGRGVWALKFGDGPAFRAFLDEYDARLFENTYGMADDDAGRKKVFGADSALAGVRGRESAASAAAWAADGDEAGPDDEPEPATPPRDGRVGAADAPRALLLGAGDASFLARDAHVDVLRNVAGGVRPTGASFALTPGRGRDALTPGRLLLMRGESRLAALTPDAASRLYDADAETGAVVAEWTFKKDGVDIPVDDIANEARGAQLDDRSTFLGLGANRLVRWDMRTAAGAVSDSPVVQWAGGKDYARGARFSCLASSGAGCVAVGSADGQLRLFSDKTLTRASTALPGLGAPVTAVDVTFDGRWVLATTDRYLMVVKAAYTPPTGGPEKSAFTSRAGAGAPAPRLLRLKAEDVASLAGAPLAKGRFTWVTDAGSPERWISPTCGPATVLWSLDAVKKASSDVTSHGGLTTVTDYHLIRKGDAVVDAAFVHARHGTPGGTPRRAAGGTPGSGRRRRPASAGDGMVIVTQSAIFSAAADDSE